MKDQYFGDVNDYRKYGLLRCIQAASGLRLLVAWMLTPDDGSSDGSMTAYLADAGRWAGHDPELFDGICRLLARRGRRRVGSIQQSSLLAGADFFARVVPDLAPERERWFRALARRADASELVFLDPDNGLEIASKPYGRRGSSKYLFWHEVRALWARGQSLLIYQHFAREPRADFVRHKLDGLRASAEGCRVQAFSTPRVAFLLALQRRHRRHHTLILDRVRQSWDGQIHPASAPAADQSIAR